VGQPALPPLGTTAIGVAIIGSKSMVFEGFGGVGDGLARLRDWRPRKSPHQGETVKGKLEGHWRRKK